MRVTWLFAVAILSLPLPSPAQVWFPIDTVTNGITEERHPALTENCWDAVWNPGEAWVLFECWTPTESRIEGRRFLASTRRWDTTTFLLSSAPLYEMQQHPALGEFGRTENAPLRIAAWQQWSGGHWRIMASRAADSAVTWSAPVILADGDEDCVSPLVRRSGRGPLISWRRGNVICGSLATESDFSVPDTLAVGTDSLEYDVQSDGWGGRNGIVWRPASGGSRNTIFFRVFQNDPYFPTEIDTATFPFDFSSPQLTVNPYPFPSLFCNVGPEGARDLLFFGGEWHGWEFIAQDRDADEANGRGISPPMIVKAGSTPGIAYFYGAGGYERTVPGDTALIFMRAFQADTVRSSGFNRNLRVGSIIFINGTPGVLSVWESNRTGRTHIYGRFLEIIWGGVEKTAGLPEHPTLLPNYPNPFNPSTSITFELSHESDVVLDVVDLPGRVVATLIKERTPAGVHTAVFDGRGCGSGAYFCRLRVGGVALVRPMLLVK